MASSRALSEDGKSDDLDIVSVGVLYSGSWEKKYWSSSRGKDRFPYPVGYKAVRAHNGITYYIEIEEGAKGPLFLIRYLAESWTGQTPDIVWKKFQKTGISHFKIWHGKRFSCKMNGMEFFGFRNPMIQRLLRELVTNSKGTVESSPSSRASQIRVEDEQPVMCANQNLICQLERPVARKKRSRKSEKIYQNSEVKDDHKKPRLQDKFPGGEILNSTPVSTCSAKGKVEIVGLEIAPPEQLHSSQATNENSNLPSENPAQVEVFVSVQKTDQLHDSCRSKPLFKFSEELHGLQEKENKSKDDISRHESQDMSGFNLCALDTLGVQQENSISSATKMDDDTSSEKIEELTLANMVVSEGCLAKSNTADLADSGLNLTSKNSDSDSAHQETAKSMFSFLLPQVIPLLKKSSSHMPPKNDMSGIPSSRLNLPENGNTSQLDDALGADVSLSIKTWNGDDENIQIVAPNSVQDFTSNLSIAHDSFDESHVDVPGNDHIISSSRESYPAYPPKILIAEEQVAVVNANLSVSALETTEIINPSSHDVSTILEESNQDEYVKKSMSIPHCTSSTDKILSEECAAKENLLPNEDQSENNKPNSTFSSSEGNGFDGSTTPTEVGSINKEKHKVYSRKRVSSNQQRRNRNSSFESKSSCINTGDNDSINKKSPIKTSCILELQPTLPTNSVSDRRNPLGDRSVHVTEQCHGPELMKVDNEFTNVLSNEGCVEQQVQQVHAFGNASVSPSSFPATKAENFQARICEALGIQVSEPPSTKSQNKENSDDKSISSVPGSPGSSNLKLNRDVKANNDMEKTAELLGCYFHPMPVSSVTLQSVGNEIYICVLSFATEDRFRSLFMYKISAKTPSKGLPSVIGHTPVILPIVDNKSGGNIISGTVESSCLHFTPDGEHLILIGNIKTPYCRKREIDCSCLTCTSACFEEKAVRIVQVETGHVSLVTKLHAVDSVQCVVVCDPNYLIAAVKNENLLVWAMDSHWRSPTEEFVIPANPCISSCILELKKIPRCPHLIIGHNGIGEFTIWDISKRSLVSRFESPSNVIYEFIPTSLFTWYPVHSHSRIEDHVDMVIAATKLWFSKGVNNKTLVPAEAKDTAIWLLVSTDLDSEAKCDPLENPATCWRLALLVRNQVTLGSQLDPRANVAGTVCGHGVAGTLDGLVYMWDLSTGAKLGSLHDFKGKGVSCISSDDSGNICIASEDQLLVYCRPE